MCYVAKNKLIVYGSQTIDAESDETALELYELDNNSAFQVVKVETLYEEPGKFGMA